MPAMLTKKTENRETMTLELMLLIQTRPALGKSMRQNNIIKSLNSLADIVLDIEDDKMADMAVDMGVDMAGGVHQRGSHSLRAPVA